ncbi:MAG: hypothetical protein NZ703_01790 [Gemmataceae bacterium]|nr:hypothetical protein [Gemmataceae bacterium]
MVEQVPPLQVDPTTGELAVPLHGTTEVVEEALPLQAVQEAADPWLPEEQLAQLPVLAEAVGLTVPL